MKRLLHLILTMLAIAATPLAFAQQAPRQNHDELRMAVRQFLTTQATGLPGEVNVTVSAVDPHLNLPACTSLDPFMPRGSRAWGKTSVGVRCAAPAQWTVYLKAVVSVHGEFLSAAVPLAQGQVIGAADIVKNRGDLTALPPGVVTNPAEAVGRKAAMSIALGAPLRKDLLRVQQVVHAGQNVRVVSGGPGFKVSTEGRAIGAASDGQTVQIRTASGHTISGIARLGGVVEVNF